MWKFVVDGIEYEYNKDTSYLLSDSSELFWANSDLSKVCAEIEKEYGVESKRVIPWNEKDGW